MVLTTDCGAEVDDQWALRASWRSARSSNSKGVVTTHAPNLAKPAAESSARAARARCWSGYGSQPGRLCSRVRASRLPTRRSRGSTRAWTFSATRRAAHSPEDRLVVLIIGAATDVASALLADPTLADRITIVAMGFDGWPGGGDPWNVKNDVKAWQVVLESRSPIVVGDAAVTKSPSSDDARESPGPLPRHAGSGASWRRFSKLADTERRDRGVGHRLAKLMADLGRGGYGLPARPDQDRDPPRPALATT